MSRKFNNLTDVLVAKERYKYNLKTKEDDLVAGIDEFRYSMVDAARNSAFQMATKAITAIFVSFVQKRYGRRKKRNQS